MLQQLAKFLAPPCCLCCGFEGSPVCRRCWPSVFQPVQVELAGTGGVIAAGVYAGVLRELVRRLKYHHQREVADVFAQVLLPALEPRRFEFDVVTAVPVVLSRFRRRGYNQAELIAAGLARGLALPYRRILWRVRATRQVGKTRVQRIEHIRGAFAAKGAAGGLRVLLIDDVLTTGATMSECARVLQRAGAAGVWGAVAARDLIT